MKAPIFRMKLQQQTLKPHHPDTDIFTWVFPIEAKKDLKVPTFAPPKPEKTSSCLQFMVRNPIFFEVPGGHKIACFSFPRIPAFDLVMSESCLSINSDLSNL